MIKSVWLILNFYDLKKDTNNDGIVNWLDFEAAVEVDLILKRIIIFKNIVTIIYTIISKGDCP